MPSNRRHLITALGALGACSAAGLPLAARAQGGPVEGTHYVRLQQPAPVSAPAGKIEVLEFFWYGCPHCNTLEATLEGWVQRLPADVQFRRVPVGFGAIHEQHQKLFYALEALGALDGLHKKIFATIHQQRQMLGKEADQIAFVGANGVDKAKFGDALKSFGVATKLRQANQLSAAYKIDSVPALGIHGRFYTAGSLAGNNERALAVAEFLVAQVRKSR